MVDAVGQARALYGFLAIAVDDGWYLYPGQLDGGGQYVDEVRILVADAARLLYTLGVEYDERIACATFGVGVLLPVFERCVGGHGPAQRIVGFGGFGAEQVYVFEVGLQALLVGP